MEPLNKSSTVHPDANSFAALDKAHATRAEVIEFAANARPVAARRARSRIALELDAPALEALDRLRSETGGLTNVAVVRSALRLYDFLSQQKAAGWSIHLVKGNEAKELVVL